MAAAKHSPGPWRVDDHPRRQYPRVVDARGRFVADCTEDAAPLIAAAPELLEALRLIAEGCTRPMDTDSCGQPMVRVRFAAIEHARAAIAKATS